MAAYSAVAGIGASAGLVVGGILTDLGSWRAGFFLDVPIAIAMIIAVPRVVGETERRAGRFDLIGAVCAPLGMTALVSGIVDAADAGCLSVTTIGAFEFRLLLLAVAWSSTSLGPSYPPADRTSRRTPHPLPEQRRPLPSARCHHGDPARLLQRQH